METLKPNQKHTILPDLGVRGMYKESMLVKHQTRMRAELPTQGCPSSVKITASAADATTGAITFSVSVTNSSCLSVTTGSVSLSAAAQPGGSPVAMGQSDNSGTSGWCW
jgi:hypothetical protein